MRGVKLGAILALASLAGCAGDPSRFAIPETAPEAVTVTWARVTPEWLAIMCPQFADRRTYACATFNLASPVTCTIYTTADVDERLIGHELLHCYLGAFHQ